MSDESWVVVDVPRTEARSSALGWNYCLLLKKQAEACNSVITSKEQNLLISDI